ncbi:MULTISPECIES: STIV orfB116 family protein [Thermoanaerobacterium]|uniref:DUF1874 domain-containing protein n=3 Tax=Thermoanaerobacterium TaxID=28895 RepID=L0INT3_THETR|nr:MULTISPECIES: DUF1874 domain-containing protein [Thermoanaerobacterium]AFK94239.1 protein of unknown function DUF1874 [Thermoanaerobacterium saccharolyticum JW/SL-YS485]AGB20414.1 protein of unknown function (DUF1874) [Thermoanaerobacterium thermosaccharolyticum M0795]ETO39149.1 hypothetical protein V518_0737 [Thermoanaerobacterium aotearoense SCUT27]
MSVILSNAFSLQMLNLQGKSNIEVEPLTFDEVRRILSKDFVSAIGHQDTANVLSDLLGFDVPCNRINVHLTQNDVLVVAQLVGGRLPEGSTKLPDGFAFQFVKVTIN